MSAAIRVYPALFLETGVKATWGHISVVEMFLPTTLNVKPY